MHTTPKHRTVRLQSVTLKKEKSEVLTKQEDLNLATKLLSLLKPKMAEDEFYTSIVPKLAKGID